MTVLPEAARSLPRASALAKLVPTFAEIYEEHLAFVWRNARRLGVPLHLVDDVVQETFLVVHRRMQEFEARSTMRTWLIGILVNVVRAHRRRVGAGFLPTGAELDPERAPDPSAGPDERAGAAEAARIVRLLLDELDDDKRAVFVMIELEQLTASEVAEALGAPLNTVYSRLRLARAEFAAATARHRARDGWRGR